MLTLFGIIGTASLRPPPTSEPPIFRSDHNVQVLPAHLCSMNVTLRPVLYELVIYTLH